MAPERAGSSADESPERTRESTGRPGVSPLVGVVLAVGLAFASGCGSTDDGGGGGQPAVSPEDRAAALAVLAVPCETPLEGFYDAPSPPSGWSEAMRGDVVRCAYDRFVPADEMRGHFAAEGYVDPGISTGAHKIRVLYWTERDPGEPVATTATLYLPAERFADPAPLLVVGHGSVGLADACAPSREDAAGFHRDWRTQLYTFAGAGWIAMHPDFPGLGTKGVTAWMYSVDEGHAMLDATRAARKLVEPGLLSTKNALVGHSNGGHAALSAASYAASYGADGEVAATVVYAPFWLGNSGWGALLTPTGKLLLDSTFLSMTLQYFYGHLGVYEGEEHATDAFLPEKAAAIRSMLEGGCWQDVTRDEKGPASIGIEGAGDAFRPEYIDEVGPCGLPGECTTPLAETWKARWVADRPPADPSMPLVLWHGRNDDFLTIGYQKCGIDRLEAQDADLTVCIDPEGDHSSVIPNQADWVRRYLAHELLGQDAPPPCAGLESLPEEPACSLPIANSGDPSEP